MFITKCVDETEIALEEWHKITSESLLSNKYLYIAYKSRLRNMGSKDENLCIIPRRWSEVEYFDGG